MDDFHHEALGPDVLRYEAAGVGRQRYDQILDAWRDAAFAREFSRLLAEVPFNAFLWETPPVDRYSVQRAFEFTVIKCPALDRAPDPSAFREPLAEAGNLPVTGFPNLGGDATMIVPQPPRHNCGYAHLAAFCRHASAAELAALWRVASDTLSQRLSSAPLWLSSSGLGVPWLHLRLDTQPKYYAHAPYRTAPR